MAESKGFFASLFDFSFTQFITTKIIKFLYLLGMLVAGLFALFVIVSAFSTSALWGVVGLILSPLVFLLYVILVRVWLEIVIVIFRIAEHTGEIAAQGRKQP
jgi:hypothetical protein